MPRLPVDGTKVIEYRMTLGTYERERLDRLITSLQVKNIGDPIVAIMKDISATATLLIILSEVFGFNFKIPEIVDDAGDLVKAFIEQGRQSFVEQEESAAPGRANSLAGGLRNLLFGLIRPLVTRPEDFPDIDLGGPIYTPPDYGDITSDYVDPGLSGD